MAREQTSFVAVLLLDDSLRIEFSRGCHCLAQT